MQIVDPQNKVSARYEVALAIIIMTVASMLKCRIECCKKAMGPIFKTFGETHSVSGSLDLFTDKTGGESPICLTGHETLAAMRRNTPVVLRVSVLSIPCGPDRQASGPSTISLPDRPRSIANTSRETGMRDALWKRGGHT